MHHIPDHLHDHLHDTITVSIIHSDQRVQLVLGLTCPRGSRTWLPNKMPSKLVRAVTRWVHLLGQASPTSCWTAMFEDCLDRPVRQLVGTVSPSR